MAFEIIPALDLSGGRLARLSEGRVVPVDAYGGDPAAAAEALVAEGAAWLHVVDLDLALEGTWRNLEVVVELARRGMRVQASGGITTGEEVTAALDAGAGRVVLGSAALGPGGGAREILERFGPTLVVGLETDGEALRPRGRDLPGGFPLAETLAWLRGAEASAFLVTAIPLVGTLSGPDAPAAARIAESLGRPVLVAGGISTAQDVRLLRGTPGIEGVVVGRALLEGELHFSAALEAAEANPEA